MNKRYIDKLIDKNIPDYVVKSSTFGDYSCPVCGTAAKCDGREHKFCSECGKALSWLKVHEKKKKRSI